jgi:hypothetical protein
MVGEECVTATFTVRLLPLTRNPSVTFRILNCTSTPTVMCVR